MVLLYICPCADLSKLEIPTLLHLTAKHGLTKLTGKLVDLPESERAISLRNVDGRRPVDLAEVYERHATREILNQVRLQCNQCLYYFLSTSSRVLCY